MPSGVSSVISGLQGGQRQTNPYSGAPGLNQLQAANILQQLRGGAGPAGGAMMGALPAGVTPQTPQQQQLAAMIGAQTNNRPANAYTGGMMTGGPAMQQYMQGLGGANPYAQMGFGGYSPMQPAAYAQPAQNQMSGFQGFGGRAPVQPNAYAQPQQQNQANPYALLGW